MSQLLSLFQGMGQPQKTKKIIVEDCTPIVKSVAESLIGDNIDENTPLMEAGLDSLGVVEFKNKLSQQIPDVKLSDTVLFDYPTLSKLSEYINSNRSQEDDSDDEEQEFGDMSQLLSLFQGMGQ